MSILDRYCGIYRHEGYGKLRIERDGDRLVARLTTITCPLAWRQHDTFELCHGFRNGAWIMRFVADDSGRIHTFNLDLGAGIEQLVFKRDD